MKPFLPLSDSQKESADFFLSILRMYSTVYHGCAIPCTGSDAFAHVQGPLAERGKPCTLCIASILLLRLHLRDKVPYDMMLSDYREKHDALQPDTDCDDRKLK